MSKQFKRNHQLILSCILLGLGFLDLIIYIFVRRSALLLAMLILYAIIVIAMQFIMAPDYDYYVAVSRYWIIFEFSESDHRIISRKFTISNENRKFIIVDDGATRIKLSYDEEVIEFLNSVRKF